MDARARYRPRPGGWETLTPTQFEQACANVPVNLDKPTRYGSSTRLALHCYCSALPCIELHTMKIWHSQSFPKVLSAGSVHFSGRVLRLEAESGFMLALTLDGLVVPMWRSSPHGFASGRRGDKAIGICSLRDVRFACRGRLGIGGDVHLPLPR